jgi:BirA family biotin operon repressor/biotin-[acetyl-CoA-carboxylase] ligase
VSAFDIRAVRRRLPGRHIDWHETIDSTMNAAVRLAAAEFPPGTVVLAEEQSAGQGRHGHAWHSEAGCGLYLSIVLRLPAEAGPQPVLTLALGLAAVEAIARVTGVRCDLRWPNDVMYQDLKVGGILVQLAGRVPIAGIGINVNHFAFPPELAASATSLRLVTGNAVSREDLLCELLPAVDGFCNMLVEGGKQVILDLFSRCSSYASGKRVTVDMPEGTITGVTAGLDSSGFLRVRTDDGATALVLAGGVRAAGA